MRQSGILQAARTINLLLFSYANDHGGKYPEGKTSTEVFQKLIDGGYVSDSANQDGPSGPKIFYFPMPGKVKPESKILRPENVCWDVTSGVDGSSPVKLPLVYMTGYRIAYKSGGSAIPEAWPARTWGEWLTAADYPRGYIAVGYLSNAEVVLNAAPDGSIPNFISPVPNGFYDPYTTYRQLKPDGLTP